MTSMKPIYTKNGYRFYECYIDQYTFTVTQSPENIFQFQAPYGDTADEKEMFDSLVYGNTLLLSGKDWASIVISIKNFIQSYGQKRIAK